MPCQYLFYNNWGILSNLNPRFFKCCKDYTSCLRDRYYGFLVFKKEKLLYSRTLRIESCTNLLYIAINFRQPFLVRKALVCLYRAAGNKLVTVILCFYNTVTGNSNAGVYSQNPHNNLQLAFSNAQELIAGSGKRNLLIDASILGMGRGAGNLCTEILTQYINENMEYRYHTELLIELMDEYISPISYIHPWGYSAGYFLAATNNCHPNYVGFLLNKQTLNVKRIYQVLKEIPEEERALYNEKLIDSLYQKFQENEIDDTQTVEELKEMLKGKKILITAPGKSMMDEKDRIQSLIEQVDMFIICVNSIPDYITPDLLFISNQKRFHQIKKDYGLKNLPCPVAATSNIDAGKSVKYMVNYSELTMSDAMISDNACLMLFNLLMKMGVDEINVVGFDGYHTNVERNYYAQNLINNTDREKLRQINKHIQKYMERIESHMQVNYLTESMYDRSRNHVQQIQE